MIKTRNKLIGLILGVLVGAGLLWFACRGVDLRVVAEAVSGVRVLPVVLGILLMFVSILIRALLWKEILSCSEKIPLSAAFKSLLIGNAGNQILPARLGDILRVYALKKYKSVNGSFAFGALIVEKILDLFVLSFLVVAVLVFGGPSVSFLDGARKLLTGWPSIVVAAAIVVGVLLYKRFRVAERELPGRAFLSSVLGKLNVFGKDFRQALIFDRGLKIVFLTLLMWACTGYYIHLLMLSFSIDTPVLAVLNVLMALNLAFLLPAIPGNIGVYQFICVGILAFWGVDQIRALGFSFVLQAVDYIPTTIVGFWLAMRLNILTPKLEDQLMKAVTPEA